MGGTYLDPSGGAFWASRWHPAADTGGARLVVLDPEDGRRRHRGGLLGGRRRRRGPGRAQAVLAGDLWPGWERREALYRAAVLLRERQELFAGLISREGCKPTRDAHREVLRAVETVRLSAEQAARLEGRTLPFGDTPRGENRLGWYAREPVGVVGAITPFNDPSTWWPTRSAPP